MENPTANRQMIAERLMQLAVSLGVELLPERSKLYLQELQDLPMDTLARSLGLRLYDRFPSIKEIRERAGVNELTPAEEAEQAWYAIRNWTQPLKDMPLKGTALEVVKAMGGRGNTLTSFGNWLGDQENFKKKEFIGRYVDLLRPPAFNRGLELTDREARGALDSVGFLGRPL